MAEQESLDVNDGEGSAKKRSKIPLLLGIVLALAGGGGGFFVVQSGMILGPEKSVEAPEKEMMLPIDSVAFVEVDPILVSLGPRSANDYLRFSTQLEVRPGSEEDVRALLPRVVDVLNGYLRAVDVAELEKPSALVGLRAQMLRRVQVVVGPGHVNDLLIMEFVLN